MMALRAARGTHAFRWRRLASLRCLSTQEAVPEAPGAKSRLSTRSSKLLAGLVAGDRYALAQAVTLTESTRRDDCVEAEALLAAVAKECGHRSERSFRLGVCGPPGVGKSSFVEALGSCLLDDGFRGT